MQHGSISPRRIGAVAALAAFAGLAGAALSGPAAAAGPFDGVYSGNAAPVAGSNPSCFGVHRRVRVVNNHFNAVIYFARFSLDIAPDGSFSGTSMQTYSTRGSGRPVTLRGRIAGGSMAMDYGNPVCRYHSELTKG